MKLINASYGMDLRLRGQSLGCDMGLMSVLVVRLILEGVVLLICLVMDGLRVFCWDWFRLCGCSI